MSPVPSCSKIFDFALEDGQAVADVRPFPNLAFLVVLLTMHPSLSLAQNAKYLYDIDVSTHSVGRACVDAPTYPLLITTNRRATPGRAASAG